MEKRSYRGTQMDQGRSEAVRFWESADSDLFTVKGVSLALGIRLQKVGLLPVQRHIINKRGYYRKGELLAWIEEDVIKPDSLLHRLRAEHAATLERMKRQPSRRYVAGQLSRGESKEARAKSKANKGKPPMDAYEESIINWANHWKRLNR